MNKPITFTEEIYKGTKVYYFYNCTSVYFTLLRFSYYRMDHFIGFGYRLSVWRGNFYNTFVINIHFCTRYFNYFSDYFSA